MERHTCFKSVFTAIILCINIYSYSQVFIETTPTSKSADPVINMYGAGDLIVSIPYEKIKGSAFWNDNYQLAYLFGDNTMSKWFCRSRLNLVTGDVYFLD